MNTMQKVTAVVVLLWEAVLFALAASESLGTDWPRVIVFAVASGLVGAMLVVVFARGTVIARLQKGTTVLALAAAVFALAVPVVPDRYVPGWQRRLAQYPELRGDTSEFGWMTNAEAMDAVDSVISEQLLADDLDLWRRYGSLVVDCAHRHAVSVEMVAATIRRESTELRRPLSLPELDPHASAVARMDALLAAGRRQNRWRLDSVVSRAASEALSDQDQVGTYSVPKDVWLPAWPARLALGASVLLVGLAIVVILGLLRRKPKQSIHQ